MRLSNLIASNEELKLYGTDAEITGIATDSRKVKPGFLFIAVPGTKRDGRIFIADAMARGAAAIVVTNEAVKEDAPISFVTAPNIRTATAALAAKFYPRQPETIAAITGTSGKTSTAQFVRQIWAALGYKSASLGTLGLITSNETRYGSLTTPDPVEIHQLLDECAGKDITHLAIEASSHGLDLHRLDQVRVQAAGFTNLSRDHLDYHPTMEAYFAAKLRLFTDILQPGATAVLNADISEYEKLATAALSRGLKVISYGKNGIDIKLMGVSPDSHGQVLDFELFGKKHKVLLPIIGGFQAWNVLCALGLVIGCDADADNTVAALGKVTDVPGRLQLVGHNGHGGAIFVDYAHKPDALENVLKALRPHAIKMGVVFGCGGDRDKGKRPIMGEIATRLADWVIVTDDNPRHEEPSAIRQEILSGCALGSSVQEISDRAEAIRVGITQLQKGDVLIIAGKGHESGQTTGEQTVPFDDVEVARKAMKA